MTEYEKQLELRVAELESKIDEILSEQELNYVPKYNMCIGMRILYSANMYFEIAYKLNIDHVMVYSNTHVIHKGLNNFECDIQEVMENIVYENIITIIEKNGFNINYFISDDTGMRIEEHPGCAKHVISALVIKKLRKINNKGIMIDYMNFRYHLNNKFNRLYFLKRFILGR